jgi:hypothetical protein
MATLTQTYQVHPMVCFLMGVKQAIRFYVVNREAFTNIFFAMSTSPTLLLYNKQSGGSPRSTAVRFWSTYPERGIFSRLSQFPIRVTAFFRAELFISSINPQRSVRNTIKFITTLLTRKNHISNKLLPFHLSRLKPRRVKSSGFSHLVQSFCIFNSKAFPRTKPRPIIPRRGNQHYFSAAFAMFDLSSIFTHVDTITHLRLIAISGTTGQVALELGRNAILIELNPEYAKLIEQRTNVTPAMF